MDSAAAPPLSHEELRHVLSNPSEFDLKEHVWFAIDSPQWFVEEQPQHALAARLGTSAEQLAALSGQYLASTGNNKPVLDTTQAKVATLLSELNGHRRHSSLALEMALARDRVVCNLSPNPNPNPSQAQEQHAARDLAVPLAAVAWDR